MLVAASGGATACLFPGLAAAAFTAGNLLASSAEAQKKLANPDTHPTQKFLLHPATYYGLGYTMTAITIGGGVPFFLNPLDAPMTSVGLVGVGIAETAVSLKYMASGKADNMAVPFVGVAAGTLCFAGAAVVTGNLAGVATALSAFCGETNLAVLEQQKYNLKLANASEAGQEPPKEAWLGRHATAPIRGAMNLGWIPAFPAGALQAA